MKTHIPPIDVKEKYNKEEREKEDTDYNWSE